MIRFTLNKYVNLDLTVEKNREMIVDGLVGSVLIFNDGKVILTLNFKNEPIISSLDEIIAAANACSDNACFASPKKSATLVADFFIQADGTEAWYVITASAVYVITAQAVYVINALALV